MFGLSGATYSGQFLQGEMHGQGLLRKTSGEQYEGSWVNGKKEGACVCSVAGSQYDARCRVSGRKVNIRNDSSLP